MAFFPKSMEQVDEIAAEVARDIRSQYTHRLPLDEADDGAGFRRVKVTARQGMGKLTVRTRTGYFPATRAARRPASQKK